MKRFLLMLPTLGLILILAFVLQSYSAKDEVGSLVTLDGERGYSSRLSYMKSYAAYAKKLGYDRPLFYFSIRPDYIPDNIDAILPRVKNNAWRTLLKETQDTEALMILNRKLNYSLDELEKNERNNNVRKLLAKMEIPKDLQELKSLGLRLEENQGEAVEGIIGIGQITKIVRSLKYRSDWVFPKFTWHGSYNRFHLWISDGLRLGGGISLTDGTPARIKVYNAMKWTVAMSIITLILISVGSLLLSLFQVHYRNGFLDTLITTKLYAIYTMPLFWIATIMVVFFTTSEYGQWTNIFPSVGIKRSYGEDVSFISQLANNASRLILPVLLLSLHSLAYITKQLKEEMLSTLKAPFIIAARARGLTDFQILKNHVLPNSLISYVTLISGGLASLFTGSVVIEVIFNIPGLGRLLLDSMNYNDWPVIFLILILVSLATMLGYLIGDLLLGYLSPKIRREMEIA